MWVKICANTNVHDSLLAAELGADAAGFVFAPSPRQVTAAQVRAIAAEMPPEVERVGVFAGATAEEIVHAASLARLTGVQLHGGLDLPLAEQLGRLLGGEVAVIHTLHWKVGHDTGSAAKVAAELKALAAAGDNQRVLIDAKIADSSGGLGVSFDWNEARHVLQSQPGLRVIVAGGLQPGNVAEAVKTLEPWGLDVASGVEARPGLKDAEKMRQFMENARKA